MEEWRDQGIVLSARPHGEGGAVVSLLTERHGRHAGYVRGASSGKMRGVLDQGNLVSANWRARTSDNLGAYTLEQERNLSAGLLSDGLKLSALQSACALCDAALPEREEYSALFYGLLAMMDVFDDEAWGAAYVVWEIALLKELGFGVDLSRCAGNGDPDTLCYLSPKSGCAVSAEKGEPYKGKLLTLPLFLRPQRPSMKGEETEGGSISGSDEDILTGLQMTGYFLEHRVFAHHSRGIPTERLRFQERFAKTVGRIEKDNEDGLAHGTGS